MGKCRRPEFQSNSPLMPLLSSEKVNECHLGCSPVLSYILDDDSTERVFLTDSNTQTSLILEEQMKVSQECGRGFILLKCKDAEPQ